MSGGSWEYFFGRLDDVADRLKAESCPLRRALGSRLKLAATALHAIEWVDSCDRSKGSELDDIRAALGKDAEFDALAELVADAKRVRDAIAEQLVRIDRAREGS